MNKKQNKKQNDKRAIRSFIAYMWEELKDYQSIEMQMYEWESPDDLDYYADIIKDKKTALCTLWGYCYNRALHDLVEEIDRAIKRAETILDTAEYLKGRLMSEEAE